MSAKQTLRFCAAILLGGHCFEVDWICCRCCGEVSSRLLWGKSRQKVSNNILEAREVQHLFVKLRNEPIGIVV
jgi:hypothetical protein